MEIELKPSILAFFILCCSCTSNQVSQLDITQRKEWVKDYAFCWCVKKDSDQTLNNPFQEDPSLGILFDIGDVWFYEKIDSLTVGFLQEIDSRPGERHGDPQKKPVMFRCLEFRKSKQLDSLVNNLMREEK